MLATLLTYAFGLVLGLVSIALVHGWDRLVGAPPEYAHLSKQDCLDALEFSKAMVE